MDRDPLENARRCANGWNERYRLSDGALSAHIPGVILVQSSAVQLETIGLIHVRMSSSASLRCRPSSILMDNGRSSVEVVILCGCRIIQKRFWVMVYVGKRSDRVVAIYLDTVVVGVFM